MQKIEKGNIHKKRKYEIGNMLLIYVFLIKQSLLKCIKMSHRIIKLDLLNSLSLIGDIFCYQISNIFHINNLTHIISSITPCNNFLTQSMFWSYLCPDVPGIIWHTTQANKLQMGEIIYRLSDADVTIGTICSRILLQNTECSLNNFMLIWSTLNMWKACLPFMM